MIKWLRRTRRKNAATQNFPWFRAGYISAIEDIERTGLIPKTDQTKRESADRSLKKWIDDESA